LYRCGRQAEALAAYQGIRRAVVHELGVEPGPELRELHQRILAADPGLRPDAAPAASGRPAADPDGTIRGREPGRAVPHQLPAGPRHFAGREDELGVLTGLLADAGGLDGAVVISAIGGTAGIGKTALAVHWAHHVADRFPDGQLYVNLRGYDPEEPMPAADALAGFLRALGVPGHAAAAGPAGRRRGPADGGTGGILVVLPAPGLRCRARIPAAQRAHWR
jgi:hypothetical protein